MKRLTIAFILLISTLSIYAGKLGDTLLECNLESCRMTKNSSSPGTYVSSRIAFESYNGTDLIFMIYNQNGDCLYSAAFGKQKIQRSLEPKYGLLPKGVTRNQYSIGDNFNKNELKFAQVLMKPDTPPVGIIFSTYDRGLLTSMSIMPYNESVWEALIAKVYGY